MRFCNAGALLCLVFLLGRPPLKGGASPRLPLTSLDTFIRSPASFFSLAARPLPPGSAHSYLLLLFSSYLFTYFLSHFPYCGPTKEGAVLSPSISILFYLSPYLSSIPFSLFSAQLYCPPAAALARRYLYKSKFIILTLSSSFITQILTFKKYPLMLAAACIKLHNAALYSKRQIKKL